MYYNNAIYAIAGLITGYMNLQVPLSSGEAKKPRHKRTEIRISAWMKQGNIDNMDSGADVQDGAKDATDV